MASVHEKLNFELVGKIPPYVPSTKEYIVQGKKILAVAADVGGFNALSPVLLKALVAGCEIILYLTGACGKRFQEGNLKVDQRIHTQIGDCGPQLSGWFFGQGGIRHLMVVAAAQSDEGALAATCALSMASEINIPSLAIEDVLGSLHPTLRQTEKVSVVCTTDKFARDFMLRSFPRLAHEKVVATGGPQFDKVKELKATWHQRRGVLRSAAKVTSSEIVILVVGGLHGTVEMLKMVEEGVDLAGVTDKVRVILRAHSRASDEDQQQARAYFAATHRDWFTDVPMELAANTDALLPIADVALSPFSTTLDFAILCEMGAVAYAGTPECQAYYRSEKGMEGPPQVGIGAAWYPRGPGEFAQVLAAITGDSTGATAMQTILANQRRLAASNDGHAADRIWQEMEKLMIK